MPYSKNPDKYPPEIQQIPHLLARATQDCFTIPAASRSEAAGRRVQIQSYFAALERRAEDMRTAALRARDRQLKAANLAAPTGDRIASPQRSAEVRRANEEAQEAIDLAELWEERAKLCRGWMVRLLDDGQRAAVQIERRTTGAFGAALLETLAAGIAPAPSAPPAGQLHQPTQEELLEQLRAETAQLNAANRR